LQFGSRALLVGVDEPTRATLALLDGTRDHAQVLAAAEHVGCPAHRANDLLDLLAGDGLLEDAGGDRSVLSALARSERERLAPDLGSLSLVRHDGGLPAAGHRRATRVLVAGGGRVGAPLAAMLAAAGVVVDVHDGHPASAQDCGVGGLDLDDIGRGRGAAVRERIAALIPSCAADTGATPDLVVLAPSRPAELEVALEQLEPNTPHLLAQVRDTVGVVGPFVLPGRTPCLRCCELTRTDLDPGWPALSAQLACPTHHREACDGPLAVMVAAQAALQVLLLIDGTADPAALGGTLELALPDWRWRRRSWPSHPACGCGASDRA
jgi:hypothetical protein